MLLDSLFTLLVVIVVEYKIVLCYLLVYSFKDQSDFSLQPLNVLSGGDFMILGQSQR